jgi:hypothetical protein
MEFFRNTTKFEVAPSNDGFTWTDTEQTACRPMALLILSTKCHRNPFRSFGEQTTPYSAFVLGNACK